MFEKGKAVKVEAGKEARAKQLGVLSLPDKTPIEPESPHNTRNEIAKQAGVSVGTAARAAQPLRSVED